MSEENPYAPPKAGLMRREAEVAGVDLNQQSGALYALSLYFVLLGTLMLAGWFVKSYSSLLVVGSGMLVSAAFSLVAARKVKALLEESEQWNTARVLASFCKWMIRHLLTLGAILLVLGLVLWWRSR